MNGAYQRYLDLSIVHFMAFPEATTGAALLESLEQIATDPFFTAIEVGFIQDDTTRREAAAMLAASHLKVAFGAQPIVLKNGLNPHSPDERTRQKALEHLQRAADQAAELGAARMSLVSGPVPNEGRADQVDLFADFLDRLSTYVEDLGLTGLVLETFDFDMDKRALIGPNRDAASLAATVRTAHPEFGLMVDLSHLPLQHESIHDGLKAVADFLVHAHIGNCVVDPRHPIYGDQHPRFGLDGGENDTPEVLAFLTELFAVGFLGRGKRPFLGFEVKPLRGESAKVVIANAKRVFVDAWAQLEVST